MKEKPLFIPLNKEHYDAFASGEKHSEFRLYGPRWNSKTCYSGRDVILSRGYGKSNRLAAKILSAGIAIEKPEAWIRIYGADDKKGCWCINLIDIKKIS